MTDHACADATSSASLLSDCACGSPAWYSTATCLHPTPAVDLRAQCFVRTGSSASKNFHRRIAVCSRYRFEFLVSGTKKTTAQSSSVLHSTTDSLRSPGAGQIAPVHCGVGASRRLARFLGLWPPMVAVVRTPGCLFQWSADDHWCPLFEVTSNSLGSVLAPGVKTVTLAASAGMKRECPQHLRRSHREVSSRAMRPSGRFAVIPVSGLDDHRHGSAWSRSSANTESLSQPAEA